MGLLLEVLRTVEFLADGPPELPGEFMQLGRSCNVGRGHAFWKAGHSPQGVVIPVTGELGVIKSDSRGRELCYAFFGPGECAGAPCVLDNLPYANDVRALRGGEFFVVGRAEFLRFLDGRPGVRSRVLATVGQIIRRSMEERDRIVFLPVNARLARFLLERACVRQADGARLLLRETHAEVAIRVGSVREVVARAMADFAKRGLIRRTHRGLFIIDWAGLSAEAGCGRGETPDCSCEPEKAAVRTRRFVVPALARGASQIDDEARVCHEHTADLSPCIARGCPLAVAAGATPGNSPVPASASKRSSPAARAAFGVGPAHISPRAAARRDVAGPADPRRRLADRASPGDPPPRAIRRATGDDAFARSRHEEHVIERRIEVYRTRAAAIESSFGAEELVPASASVFQEAAEVGHRRAPTAWHS